MPTSVQPSNMYWHHWFAWRPVFVIDRVGRRRLVWFQGVERRWTEGNTSGLGPRWVYRRVQEQRKNKKKQEETRRNKKKQEETRRNKKKQEETRRNKKKQEETR